MKKILLITALWTIAATCTNAQVSTTTDSVRSQANDIIALRDRINGKLDEPFCQGHLNDCWFISALISLQNNPLGRQVLEQMMVVDREHEQVRVYLQGQEYKITFREVEEKSTWSQGDPDARCFEIALDRYMQERHLGSVSHSNYIENGYEYLLGKDNIETEKYTSYEDYLKEVLRQKDIISSIGTGLDGGGVTVYNQKDSAMHLFYRHACTVADADANNFYLIDPIHPQDTLHCPLETAKPLFYQKWIMRFKGVPIVYRNRPELDTAYYIGTNRLRVCKSNILHIVDHYENSQAFMRDLNYSTRQQNTLALKTEIAQWLLNAAKKEGIYVDNYERQINEAVQQNNKEYLERELVNLYRRVAVSRTTDSSRFVASGTPFRQGEVEDDWLLAPILALRNSPYGQKRLASIVSQKEGSDSMQVTLGRTHFDIGRDEIAGSAELAVGDSAVRSIEIAVDRKLHAEKGRNINTKKSQRQAFKLVAGSKGMHLQEYDKRHLFRYFRQLKATGVAATAHLGKGAGRYEVSNGQNESVRLSSKHLYAAVGCDRKYIYLVDPAQPDNTLRCPRKVARRLIDDAVVASFSKK